MIKFTVEVTFISTVQCLCFGCKFCASYMLLWVTVCLRTEIKITFILSGSSYRILFRVGIFRMCVGHAYFWPSWMRTTQKKVLRSFSFYCMWIRVYRICWWNCRICMRLYGCLYVVLEYSSSPCTTFCPRMRDISGSI